MIADELRRQVDNFTDADELRDVVGRPLREGRSVERDEIVVETT